MSNSENAKTVNASIESGRRRPYLPPRLTSVKLRPEEAVLGGCKTAATASGMGPQICGTCFGTFIPS